MKVSLNWLKDYVDLNGIAVEDIVHKLTMAGLEVEEVVNETEIYKNFIVGLVKEKGKHPNADKLSLCKVSTGNEEFQVICGAPNVEAGQKIVFAPIGTIIPKGNFKISKAKIRGVESYGMICSEAELELSDDHSGIMVLQNGVNIGDPITEALGLNDAIMEIAITPNRSDALSHIGIARELAALFNTKLTNPEILLNESAEDINKTASVDIRDQINCPRYSAKVVKNVEVKESPEWLKQRLTKVGLRPINNIVDVTNFVMYETGQPLHAFDLDRLNGSKVIIKSTESDEQFVTLDSKQRKLPSGTLMIADASANIAIAGVMGGENSEVFQDTKNILIESAYFNPSSVRKTSKKTGLSTEASYRFERGTDPGNTVYAAERAAQLIAELGTGVVLRGVIDNYPEKIVGKKVKFRFERATRILGYEIAKDVTISIFEKLGFNILNKSETEIELAVPTFRRDIEREIDLIEEAARIDGYDNIPTISKISISLGKRFDEAEYVDKIKSAAVALGFYEIINNPLVSESRASIIGNKIPVLNPQSLDMAFLRTSLIPGALEVVSRNINYGEKNLLLFEVGNVFNKIPGREITSFDDFSEESKVIFILTGKTIEKSWNSGEVSGDFFTLKGLMQSFTQKISLDNVLKDSYYFNADTAYEYYFVKSYSDEPMGKGGKISREVLKKFDIQQDVYCFEFDLNKLIKINIPAKRYVEPLKYPMVVRDLAFIFDKETSYQDVKDFIERNGSNLLKSVQLFDLFESDSLGENKKSMAFSLQYFSPDRTLTDEEIEKVFLELISLITKQFNATLRGN